MTTKIETKKFDAEISKVLKLMIHSLYTHKDIFLRELLSNASDACDKLSFEASKNDALLTGDSELKITITLDAQNNKLIITDSGIGMNKQDLIDNLGTIASSGTQKFIESMSGDEKKDTQLIGQFGVGFYSSFMVADEVEVESRKAGEKDSYLWKSKGEGEFSVEKLEKSDLERGTKITLHIKKEENPDLDKHYIKNIVQTYSDHISIPINFIDIDDKGEVSESEQLNSASALWTRGKSDITKEEYKVFYKNISHQPDEPWLTLHNKSEGLVSYTNLLFIPSMRPFDLFHPDRKTSVKLYVKKIFITEDNVEIIPRHLRFIRGIIDSEDLPLNISRETLQNNLTISKIRNAVVKKILSELKKKSESDDESYIKFWENFGAVIKEGLCEATTDKETILDLCRFKTSKSGDKYISLSKYIENMKEGQKYIYHISGENIDTLKNSPQIEGLTAKGIEVLFLNDPVDDFWTGVVFEHKEKEFRSVTKAGDELSEVEEADTDKKEKKEKAKKEPNEKIANLISYMKEKLKEQISDVKISAKLTTSPVCLAVAEGAMDIRMERMLIEQKQLAAAAKKLLEINENHEIIKNLAENLTKDGGSEEIDDLILLLLDQACILEGQEITNPNEFSNRVNRILAKAVAA